MTQTNNIDPAEIQKFENLASVWWDKEGECKPLHQMNPLRLSFINTHSPLVNKKVCDVGCGAGILTESLSQTGADVVGIDMGDSPLSVARLHALEGELTVDYQQSTAENFAEQHAACFDVVTCMEMLEHVPDPSSVIQACASLVKPGGSVYFSTINRNPKAYLLAILGAEYVVKMLPRGTHNYARFIKPSELDQWAQMTGLTLQHLQGIHYNPITGLFSYSQNVDINYMMHFTKIQTS